MSEYLQFILIIIAMLFVFALLYKVVQYWGEYKKEKLRIERIKHQIDNIEENEDEPEADPPSRRALYFR